jgi:hypothetical protein
VIDDDPMTFFEAAATGPQRDNLATRLVTGDNILIGFRALPEMLAVNGSDIGATDGRSFHSNQNFAVTGSGYIDLTKGDGAIAWEIGGKHSGSSLDHCGK